MDTHGNLGHHQQKMTSFCVPKTDHSKESQRVMALGCPSSMSHGGLFKRVVPTKKAMRSLKVEVKEKCGDAAPEGFEEKHWVNRPGYKLLQLFVC